MENLVTVINPEWVTDEEKKEIAEFLGVRSVCLNRMEAGVPWEHLVKVKMYMQKEIALKHVVFNDYALLLKWKEKDRS